MRPKERIPIFLEKINWKALAERWNLDVSAFNPVRSMRGTIRATVRHYWEQEPDLRFGQMLINIGCLQDKLRIWNDEENDILEDQNVPKREYLLWGSIYDKGHRPLKEIKWTLIKDMSTNHIEAIIRDVADSRMGIRMDYLEVFKQEIELRKVNLRESSDTPVEWGDELEDDD